MHRIHNTKAIVLDTLPYSEGSSTVLLYTQDLGLVYARAQSAREEKSKMRFALQSFSFVEVSLVHGKRAGWRITGVIFGESFVPKRDTQEIVMRLIKLFRRIIVGESPDKELFKFLIATLRNVRDKNRSKKELEYIELLAVARLLAIVGYVPKDVLKIPLLQNFEYYDEMLALVKEKNRKLIEVVNEAIVESQL